MKSSNRNKLFSFVAFTLCASSATADTLYFRGLDEFSRNVFGSFSVDETQTPFSIDGTEDVGFHNSFASRVNFKSTDFPLVTYEPEQGSILVGPYDDPLSRPTNVFVGGNNDDSTLTAKFRSPATTSDLSGVYAATQNQYPGEADGIKASGRFDAAGFETLLFKISDVSEDPIDLFFKNSFQISMLENDTRIAISITPTVGSLSDVAAIMGLTGFNFVNSITSDPNPLINAETGQPYVVPYADSVNNGNSLYYSDAELNSCVTLGAVCEPIKSSDKMLFVDAPASPSLKENESIHYETTFVGLLPNGSKQDILTVAWVSTFNGTANGSEVRGNLLPVDAGSGNGGISILDVKLHNLSAAPVPLPASGWMLLSATLLSSVLVRRKTATRKNFVAINATIT